MRDLPLAAKVHQALRFYFEVAIPDSGRDEVDGWTLRALPSTNATKHRRRLFTVNVSNMEVLVAHYDPTSNDETGGFLNAAPEKLGQSFLRFAGDREVRPVPYATAVDTVSIAFANLDDLVQLMSEPGMQAAVRRLTDRLRSSSQSPSLQSQWHVREFATWVSNPYQP